MTSSAPDKLFAGPETLERLLDRMRENLVEGIVRSDLDSLTNEPAVSGLIQRVQAEPITLGEHRTQVLDILADGPGTALDRARIGVTEIVQFTGTVGLLRVNPQITPTPDFDAFVDAGGGEGGKTILIEHTIPYSHADIATLRRRSEAHLSALRQYVGMINSRVGQHRQEMATIGRTATAQRIEQLGKLATLRSALAD